MYQLGWFSTGRDRAARDLLTAVHSKIALGEIEAEIAFVFSNREPGEAEESDLFFKLVKDLRLPLICFSSHRFKQGETASPRWRLAYDRQVMKRLHGFHPDLCVLAGYMLIVGEEMCRRYDMLNLHPAAPGGPAGSWQKVIWQLIESRAQRTGVMMHLVTPELDKGPVATYCTFPITGEPFDKHWKEIEATPVAEVKKQQGENNRLFRLIREHGLAREFPLIISTLKAFSQGKIRITRDKRMVDATAKPLSGYDLSQDIDELVLRQVNR
ncbi:MAG: phosphoglycerate transporter [Chloroflexi bacterium]|nr:phosphoglycerate transporter [Chloroflexota bacterium]